MMSKENLEHQSSEKGQVLQEKSPGTLHFLVETQDILTNRIRRLCEVGREAPFGLKDAVFQQIEGLVTAVETTDPLKILPPGPVEIEEEAGEVRIIFQQSEEHQRLSQPEPVPENQKRSILKPEAVIEENASSLPLKESVSSIAQFASIREIANDTGVRLDRLRYEVKKAKEAGMITAHGKGVNTKYDAAILREIAEPLQKKTSFPSSLEQESPSQETE